jgi:hypothetical protein
MAAPRLTTLPTAALTVTDGGVAMPVTLAACVTMTMVVLAELVAGADEVTGAAEVVTGAALVVGGAAALEVAYGLGIVTPTEAQREEENW